MKLRLARAFCLILSFTQLPSLARTPHVARPSAQASGDEARRVVRLVALCKLWGALKYFHPYLAYRDIDWDAALVATLPKVEAARTADEFASAVESLTAVLEDPATRVLRPSATTQQSANGDVTNFYVPGGIVTSFSGQAVRHADGRQLQRKGLVPDVPVTPTIKGIQTGRDEVLEAAVKYLERELAGKREK